MFEVAPELPLPVRFPNRILVINDDVGREELGEALADGLDEVGEGSEDDSVVDGPGMKQAGVKLGDCALRANAWPKVGDSCNFGDNMTEELMLATAGNVVLVAPALGAVAVLDSVEPSSLEDACPWFPTVL